MNQEILKEILKNIEKEKQKDQKVLDNFHHLWKTQRDKCAKQTHNFFLKTFKKEL